MASGLTGTYLFPYPLQTDAVDVAADVQALAQGIETTMLLKSPLPMVTFPVNVGLAIGAYVVEAVAAVRYN